MRKEHQKQLKKRKKAEAKKAKGKEKNSRSSVKSNKSPSAFGGPLTRIEENFYAESLDTPTNGTTHIVTSGTENNETTGTTGSSQELLQTAL